MTSFDTIECFALSTYFANGEYFCSYFYFLAHTNVTINVLPFQENLISNYDASMEYKLFL